jgi:hypothetical protein
VRVAVCPAQIEDDEAEAPTVGIGTTVTVLVIELVQVPLLPMMV